MISIIGCNADLSAENHLRRAPRIRRQHRAGLLPGSSLQPLDGDQRQPLAAGHLMRSREMARCLVALCWRARDLARLRKQATAEIDRLLAFLDVSDPYVSTELEDDISSDLEDGNDDELALTGICRPLGRL